MGFSSSLSVSGAPNPGSSSSSDSLNGLKFGHKIYFEDVSVGAPAKSGDGSSSSTAKKVKGVLQAGQPPRCQVEGCKVDLTDAKTYYSRHKVCGMHSKSPKVIVAGLEQRFCQQCSRFHLLPEFDQGKRSCRRRLAGHNERRRKPPPGSLFSSRYGRFSSSVFENSGSDGGILENFSAYARPRGKNPWQNTRSEWVSGNQTATTGKYVAHSWQNGSENAPSNSKLTLQASPAGTGSPSTNIASGECYTGVSNSDRALSLLSDQPWASRNGASCLGVNNLNNNEGVCVTRPRVSQGVAVNQFTNTCCFTSRCSNEISSDLDLGQLSQPNNNGEFTAAAVLARQSGMPYLELEHCRAYNSTQQMHWSL